MTGRVRGYDVVRVYEPPASRFAAAPSIPLRGGGGILLRKGGNLTLGSSPGRALAPSHEEKGDAVSSRSLTLCEGAELLLGLPDYGDWVACDLVVGGDDEHVVGDGLGDDDAVEGVSMDIREL